MGQATKNKQRLSDIVASADRCIYCANPAATVEHMPPVCMFHTRQRPKGIEFAACDPCNNGTRAADTVAAFFSRICQQENSLMITEAMKMRRQVSRLAPGVDREFFRPENTSAEWFRTRRGIIKPMIVVRSDGPLTKRYLQIFAAKFGMALYREHVGEPLPLHGAVHVIFFLNAGLAEDTVLAMLAKLPLRNTLQQGAFQVPQQFAYQYNTDQKSIVAALAGFSLEPAPVRDGHLGARLLQGAAQQPHLRGSARGTVGYDAERGAATDGLSSALRFRGRLCLDV